MDPRQYLIVDLEKRDNKRKFITESVASIKENAAGYWEVMFGNNTRPYTYNLSRLLYFSSPVVINIDKRGLYIKRKRIHNLIELLRFGNKDYTFYRVSYESGFFEYLEGREVYITRTPINDQGVTIWDYLKKLAVETSLVTEDEESILSKQYELVDLKRDTVPLAQYLGNESKLNSYRLPRIVYFPFSCNASQKDAVQLALMNQVSIIQGPPGTGKTQTILNIIGNLLMAGKTALVVSNNNSAVDNVAEKLEKEGLGFIVAKLGSVENKKYFIAHQQERPDLESWKLGDLTSVQKIAKDSLSSLSNGFDYSKRKAKLNAEYDALLTESKYYEMQRPVTEEYSWLKGLSSTTLMELLTFYQMKIERRRKPSFWSRLKWVFSQGFKMFFFLDKDADVVISNLESAFYFARKREIQRDLDFVSAALQSLDFAQNEKKLRYSSLQILKDTIAKRYEKKSRIIFTIRDIKPRTSDFLEEYPVVLSTTYSAKTCISSDMVFDYVIMDEASQVDIKTGALALSCATNAVIVGDDKQLPNVIGLEESLALRSINETYNIDDKYNALTHSFLQSCIEVFKDAPMTLLREHYRCHPKIIEFCNQQFYNGELITMTEDKNEENVLQVVRTVKGNHARERFNQREIDVITNEIMPEYRNFGDVGIISPYRQQAEEINKSLGENIASTVHKFQGRECNTVIMSMVDYEPTKFSDDPNLLNVAISRAKSHLCIVTNGNEMPKNTNLAQLIAYMRYNNLEVKDSKIHSVFDLLYKQYSAERLTYAKSRKLSKKKDLKEISENLMYDLLKQAIQELNLQNVSFLCHYPLSNLISDLTMLNKHERSFAESPYSHVDFLIYNTLTKLPLKVIEVDGWSYHNGIRSQQSRDELKDQILSKFDLRPIRISTADTVTVETIKKLLKLEN